MKSSESYFYHAVPRNMEGTTLFPLNELRFIYPAIYASALEKYEWRTSILATVLPKLGCLWNDVLHLSSAHPNEVYQALCEAGVTPTKDIQFFRIERRNILKHKAVLYHSPAPKLEPQGYSSGVQAPALQIDPEQIEILSEANIELITGSVPKGTQEYFRFEQEHGRLPLVFNGIDHILVQGSIDVSICERINWSDTF